MDNNYLSNIHPVVILRSWLYTNTATAGLMTFLQSNRIEVIVYVIHIPSKTRKCSNANHLHFLTNSKQCLLIKKGTKYYPKNNL